MYEKLNTIWHKRALNLFMLVVLAHWAEHLAQAFQIYVLGWPRPSSNGVLGLFLPWLVTTEVLHYGYALVMLVGIWILRKGFTGTSRTWWTIALVIQFWHHIEHLLLLIQAQTGTFYFGGTAPTSVAQVVFPRVELHLFYNSIVFIPMVIATYLHLRSNERDLAASACSCVHGHAAGRPAGAERAGAERAEAERAEAERMARGT